MRISKETYLNTKKLLKKYPKKSLTAIAKAAGIYRATVKRIRDGDINDSTYKIEEVKERLNPTYSSNKKGAAEIQKELCRDFKASTGIITVKSLNIKTVEDALSYAEVDMSIWEVERHMINSWEVTIGGHHTGTDKPETYTNFQVKIWLRRKALAVKKLEMLFGEMGRKSPAVPRIKRKIKSKNVHRELELSLFDIHLGLRCYKESGADFDYSPEYARKITLNVLGDLISLSDKYLPFEGIIFPVGNDFLHVDNVYMTTTHGTTQPGSEPWGRNFLFAEKLVFEMVDSLKQIAPVKVISLPGNHARHTEIALGRILAARYHNDKNVEVDAEIKPYKFHKYGVNLIGFEHGHSIKQQVRLAALMANECRLNGWREARFCEWHLGDQHRKGSGRPMMFEEQGVSVEFLPGLVVPNEWHTIHGLNWQKRAGTAFVWDKTAGPIARLQVNIDNYLGEVMK